MAWKTIRLAHEAICPACGIPMPNGSPARINHNGSVVCIAHERPFDVGIRAYITLRDVLAAGIDPVGMRAQILGRGEEFLVIGVRNFMVNLLGGQNIDSGALITHDITESELLAA